MTEFVKELLKEYKDDISDNNFSRILYHCPPMLMQELMDVFSFANINVPTSSATTYADVCCYLLTIFSNIELTNAKWSTGESMFRFNVTGGANVNYTNLRAHLYTMDCQLIKVDHDWVGRCSLTIKIFDKELIRYNNLII